MADAPPSRSNHVAVLGMFAACCIGPMLLIVVLSAFVGLTIGTSAAVAIGVVAGLFCVAFMVVRHRRPASTVKDRSKS